MHMNSETPSKQMAIIHSAIMEGEADIQAGRVTSYSPELMDDLTQEVLNENA